MFRWFWGLNYEGLVLRGSGYLEVFVKYIEFLDFFLISVDDDKC